jgi:tRNA pseudouridine65 synthase
LTTQNYSFFLVLNAFLCDTMIIPVLYQDDHYVVINKPPAILVHLTRLSEDKISIVQVIRAQLDIPTIVPVHRLDRATSGVLVLAKSTQAASWLGERLMQKTWEKKYYAIVRGFAPDAMTIDYPLTDPETGKYEPQEAITHFTKLGQNEIPWAIGLRYATTRVSLVEAEPETGRRQQIRKHFSHLRHPIMNDSQHGDVKYAAWFRQHLGLTRMLLHAHRLTFPHPDLAEPLTIHAPLDSEFERALDLMGLRKFLDV